MTELENISQTGEEQAIQASIQASLKELIGDASSLDAPTETIAETTLATTFETMVEEPVPVTIPAPTAEELPREKVTESIEIPADTSTEEATQEIAFEDSNQELSEDFAQEAVAETTQDVDDVTGDILFEEILDIDSIQQKLLERIYEDDPEIQSSQDVDTVIDKQAAIIEEKKAKLPARANSITSRKYVVYVDSENIDFMENLSIDERKAVINKILKEQNQLAIETKEFRKKKKYISHVLIACLTFIIGFPIIFIMVNKSIEASMTNYQEAKQNVAKLYKQGGKVKMEQAQQ